MSKNEAQQLMDDLGASQVITLKHPVRLATGELLEKLTVRTIKVADVRAAAVENNDVLRELLIMSRVTGLVPEDLDCLHFDDYQQLQSVFR